MSIAITITDPANTDPQQLAYVIQLLQHFQIDRVFEEPSAPPLPPSGAARTIDPEDAPNVGMPVLTPGEAFGAPGAAEAFGAAPGTPTVHHSTPPAGMPPAPNSGAAMAGGHTLANGVDLDTDGLPWDARIHAGTKSKNQDGRWKMKRGVEDHVVAQVQGELRALMGVPTPGNVPQAGAPAMPPAAPIPPAPPAPPAPNTAAGAPATIPPAMAGAQDGAQLPAIDFPTLAAKVSAWTVPTDGTPARLTPEQLSAAVAAVIGDPNVPPVFGMLYNRPDLLPKLYQSLKPIVGEA